MLFNSIEFLILFAIVFFLYWFVCYKNYIYQNLLLLISSYVFYAWWDWRFLSLIILSSIVDYSVGLKLSYENTNSKRKILLYISIVFNLGVLCIFKYFNFFIDNFIDLCALLSITTNKYSLQVILPVGISFYTFQTMSYTIDIYLKKLKPTKNIISFFTFVAFFPQLVAGPIERAKNLLPQFYSIRKFNYKLASSGAKLVLFGFFKKVVIADNLSPIVDSVYANPELYAGFPTLVATIFFTFQIYCDFSGYSDIARGLARILGLKLMKNFDMPYFSQSLGEFWTRWHISLSSWFRDYLYIPLGGNKKSLLRTNFNILLTFLISGFWHGANWTFIIWGLIHGSFLIIENFLKRVFTHNKIYFPSLLKYLSTITIVIFSWIFFRSESVSQALFISKNMFIDINDYLYWDIMEMKFRGLGFKLNELIFACLSIIALLIIELAYKKNILPNLLNKYSALKWLYYYIILFSILFFGTQNTANNFIYFQF